MAVVNLSAPLKLSLEEQELRLIRSLREIPPSPLRDRLTELMRELGIAYSECERTGLRLPVVEAHVRFIDGARYDEELSIGTRITSVSGVRVRFDYTVIARGDGRLLAEGHTVLASLGASGRPRRFPPEVRELMAKVATD